MMSAPEGAWRRALALFDEFLDLEDHELRRRLRLLEDEEPETASHLRSLLEHDHEKAAILDQPVEELLGDLIEQESTARDATGCLIGNYRLIRQIGRGGMGVVYEAQRADGVFDQKVAVKLLRWSADSEGADARFARERRILARLEHPSIARILDGGKAAGGRPYLVMELIEGRHLDSYCDENELSIEDRLHLFIEICRTLQYAHRRLVVHRDLKPSNILVDHQGRIHLLDFGIAKLLAEDQDEGLTLIGQRLMTPDYAAPEQLEGGEISTATDVYALGLILCDLLAGSHPVPRRSESGESRISPPSTAFGSTAKGREKEQTSRVAASRGLTPARLRQRLKGDLDLIVLKALRREAEERYVSPEELAADIKRHLEGFPIRARKQTALSRAGAFIRRNRGPVLAVLAVMLALMLGLASTLREARERSRQADLAEAVSDFLVDLFAGSEPTDARNSNPSALELLDRGAEKLAGHADTPPELRARLMREIGIIYLRLGRFRRSAHFSGLALLESRSLYGGDSLQAASAEGSWGASLWKLGRYRESESALKHALEVQRRRGAEQAAGETLSALSALYGSLGRFRDAAETDRQALDISRRIFGPTSVEAATDLQNLAVSLWRQGRLSEAEGLARESLEIRLERTGKDSASTASSLHNLASILSNEGKNAEAEGCFRRAVALREKIYGPAHPDLALSLSGLSATLMREGRLEESLPLAERALEISRSYYGPDHADVAVQLNNLGKRYYSLGRFKEAREHLVEALAIWKKTLPEDHPNISTALSNIGMICLAEGDLRAAEAMLRESLARERSREQPSAANLCLGLCNLGRVLDAENRSTEALAMLEEARGLAARDLDPSDSLHATIERHYREIAERAAEGAKKPASKSPS